jgi:hypothetical protein
MMRAANDPGIGFTGPALRLAAYAAGTFFSASAGKPSPSKPYNSPNAASHSRIAFSSIASNTGVRSPGELLMTPRTSAVAVC